MFYGELRCGELPRADLRRGKLRSRMPGLALEI